MSHDSHDATAVSNKVWLAREGALVSVVLNRPETLNAVDDDMVRALAAEFSKIARDADVYIVSLEGAGRAFSAGGDVKAITAEARQDLPRVLGYFRNEYALDWLLDCFSKPTVSLIDGACMGSGAGLTSFNTHRVAGERYKWAMPETAIGLFPDVGVAHVLARMPWPIGLYLGLTGRAIGRADAVALGVATHAIDAARFGDIKAALADCQPVDDLLDGLAVAQPVGPVMSEYAMIEDFFSAGTAVEIFEKLATAQGAAAEWAAHTLLDLERKSPISIAITDRHIRSARSLDLRAVLVQDYRLAVRCLEGRDFYEGVRALLIDKDKSPKWQIGHLRDVPEALVEQYFAPLAERDLQLASREEMQGMRS